MGELDRVAKIMGWKTWSDGVTWFLPPPDMNPYKPLIADGKLTDSGLVAIENRLFEAHGIPAKEARGWVWAFPMQNHNGDTREAAAIAALLALSQPEAE